MNSLRPPPTTVNSMHPSLGGVVSSAPPPAHGSAIRSSSSSSSTSKHSLPPSAAATSAHHKPHKVDPGPPPPLAPLQVAGPGGVAPMAYKPQNPPSAVTFKPYDFGRNRDISPRTGTTGAAIPSSGGVATVPSTHPAYPTAYSAPPPARPNKVTSPQVVNLYSKPIPARPESLPAAAPSGSAPPPAHSTLPPGSRAPPPTKHLLPPPVAHSHPSSGPRPNNEEDMPLDLGAPKKRRIESLVGDEEAVSPPKSIKLEENGQLHKVSEPSVLNSSEVNITTVENLVLKPPKQEIKEEPSNNERPATPPQYVHKLKKAWIKAYTGTDPDPNLQSTDAKKMESYSAPSTPNNNNNRATPSPALSSVSAASKGKKVNGHTSGHASSKNDESESSDSGSNRDVKSAKRGGKSGRGGKKGNSSSSSSTRGGRGSGRLRASNKTSDNDTLSDSDDNSKDSDTTSVSRRSGSTAQTASATKSRRGRKPKGKRGGVQPSKQQPDVSDDANELIAVNGSKKSKVSLEHKSGGKLPENPFNNRPISVLKKTGESFLQDSDCFKVAPKLAKCRECKWSQHNKNAGSSASIFCRFYGFRRLRYHVKNGQLAVAGFCDPHSKEDVTVDDAEMWEATADNAPDGLSVEQAKYCLELLKTDFDLIVSEERRAIAENIGEENDVSWKRVVQGVSESCDVCDATLFNLHWACPRCGFVVCLDCYVSRKNHTNLLNGDTKSDTSSSSSSSTKDDKDKYFWLLCTNKSQHDLDKLMLTQIVTGDALEELDKKLNNCGVKFRLAGAHNGKSKVNGLNGNGESDSGNGKGASLRDLIGSEQKVKMSDIIDACVEDSMEDMKDDSNAKLTHFIPTTDLEEDRHYRWRHGFAPKRWSYTLVETKNQYLTVPHSWLDNGCVLRLEGNTDTSAAVDLFQEIWSRGQPVVVTNATKSLNINKWCPNGLNDDFGDEQVELIDVKTGNSLGEQSLKRFLDGYNTVLKRVKDENGQPAIARLSGWPGTS